MLFRRKTGLGDKTVLITGASSGIGAELARQLSRKSCRLLLLARREEELRRLVAGLSPHPAGHRVYPCDVTDERRVGEVFRRLEDESLLTDVAILNAGMSNGFDAARFDLERMRNLFEVNLFGVLNVLARVLPAMIRRGSGIVAVTGSLAGVRGMPRAAPYSASKAALAAFVDSLRIDLVDSGVRAVLIEPGFVRTPMTDKNRFTMPFLMPVERAVRIIIRGLEKGSPEIHFPRLLSWPAKLSVLLPGRLYARLMHRRNRSGA